MARLLVDLTPLKVSPAYRRLWVGNTLSFVGTQLTLVAVSLEVFALTGSSFAVGLLGNVYSRKMGGTAFTSMVTGVLFLVPVSPAVRLLDGRPLML